MKILKFSRFLFLILATIILFYFPLFAISDYETGAKLNVLTKNGINLRDNPSSNGKKLVLIPFGSQLEVVKTNKSNPYSSEGINGFWIEVKYKKFTGYVFDGYLSKFPAPQSGCKSFKDYLDKKIGKGKKSVVSSGDYEGRSATIYPNNILYMTEGGSEFEIHFPGISKEEMYLIGKNCKEINSTSWTLDDQGAFHDTYQDQYESTIDSDENGVTIFSRKL